MKAGKTARPTSARDRLRRSRSSEGVYDLTPVVLDNIEQPRASTTWSPSAATTRWLHARSLADAACRSSPIPKTMDNDVQGTEYCIGFSTAITRAKELINRQRTTLGSHERIGVFRIFGRDAGFTALYTAYVTSSPLRHPRVRRSTSSTWSTLLVEDKRNNPSALLVRDRVRGRDLEGRRARRSTARPTPTATATRPTSAEALAEEIKRRSGRGDAAPAS